MTEVIVWSGWVGGLAIGIYALAQLIISGKLLGVSTGFGKVCAYVSRAKYFHTGNLDRENSWRLWFIIGIPIGGFLAAVTSPGEVVASMSLGAFYDAALPQAFWAKSLVLTGGGVMIGYGARLAGGCPSGHSIAGMGLLNPPSIIASAGFFVGGIIMVQAMNYFLI